MDSRAETVLLGGSKTPDSDSALWTRGLYHRGIAPARLRLCAITGFSPRVTNTNIDSWIFAFVHCRMQPGREMIQRSFRLRDADAGSSQQSALLGLRAETLGVGRRRLRC